MKWLECGVVAACVLTLSGCSSLLAESSSAGAGILGGIIAGSVTDNAGVATGIGIGIQAATKSGVQYGQRKIHGEVQQQIADAAGPLRAGEASDWKVSLSLPLEAEEAGRVAVSRIISTGKLDCKEIVIAVDRSGDKPLPASQFYVADICRNGTQWAWASAEPATGRWGALQ